MSDFQREDELDSFGEFKIMDEFDPNKRFQAGSLGARVRGLRSAALGTHNALSEAYCSMLAACIGSSTSGTTTAVIGSIGSSANGTNIVVISSEDASTGVDNSLAGGVGGVKWQLFSTPGDLRLERHAHIKHSAHIDRNLEVEGYTVLRGDVNMDRNLTVRNGAIDCTSVTVRGPLPPAGSFGTPGAFPPAGADYAEIFESVPYPSGGTWPDGLLMTLDKSGSGKVKLATSSADPVMGVTSASAAMILAYEVESDSGVVPPSSTESTVVLGLLGQVRVRISDSDPIGPGDYLMPGPGGVAYLATYEYDDKWAESLWYRRYETNIMVMKILGVDPGDGHKYAHCFISGFFNQMLDRYLFDDGAPGGGGGDGTDPGDDGSTSTGKPDQHYTHNQSTPLTTWAITHNLGKFPSVAIVTSAGEQVFGDVTYVDENAVEISFAAAFSGKAYCN